MVNSGKGYFVQPGKERLQGSLSVLQEPVREVEKDSLSRDVVLG